MAQNSSRSLMSLDSGTGIVNGPLHGIRLGVKGWIPRYAGLGKGLRIERDGIIQMGGGSVNIGGESSFEPAVRVLNRQMSNVET